MGARMPIKPHQASKHNHTDSSTTGQHFETIAARYLARIGFKLVERNYRCPMGEIDLVMLDRDTLVFVEVKYRKNANYGRSVEQVGPRKQRKLRNSALAYIAAHPRYARSALRFDIVGISPSDGELTIEWISNALETF